MKRYLVFLVALLGVTVTFGQNPDRIGIVVSGFDITSADKEVIQNYMREFLRDKYTVSIGHSDDLFKNRKEEIRFQNSGSVDPAQVTSFGEFMGVNLLCVVSETQQRSEFVFSANIFTINNGNSLLTVQHPNKLKYDDIAVTQINNDEIARAIGYLLLRLGILSPENKDVLESKTRDADNKIKNQGAISEQKKRDANVAALVKSIIPGVGLMQKGRTGEGVAYLLGDIALVGGGIGMLAYANKQQDIMNGRNTTLDQYNTAKNNYNTAKTVSYCCFGTAAALYVVNLVRSYVAEPKPGARIQWTVVPSMNPTSPYGPNMSVNLALAYKF